MPNALTREVVESRFRQFYGWVPVLTPLFTAVTKKKTKTQTINLLNFLEPGRFNDEQKESMLSTNGENRVGWGARIRLSR